MPLRNRRMEPASGKSWGYDGPSGRKVNGFVLFASQGEDFVKPFALAGAACAALLLAGCSYSTDASLLGYRTTTSFSTPGAAPAPGYYSAPAPTYSEAPPAYAPPPPAYAPPPVYYAPPAYYGPAISIGLGRWWGPRYRRW